MRELKLNFTKTKKFRYSISVPPEIHKKISRTITKNNKYK